MFAGFVINGCITITILSLLANDEVCRQDQFGITENGGHEEEEGVVLYGYQAMLKNTDIQTVFITLSKCTTY